MAKKPMLLSDLFHETLKDIYFAENKIIKALPKMAKAAQSKDLRFLPPTIHPLKIHRRDTLISCIETVGH